jgi:hypothetical protein
MVIQAGPAGSLRQRKKTYRAAASGKWVKLVENEPFTF